MTHRIRLVALLVAALSLAAGCSKNASPPASDASAENTVAAGEGSSRSAKVLPLPGQGAVPQSAGQPTSLTWDAPAGWVEETPSSQMRRAQYRVPGKAGDGECVVFYFGPGQGGDARSNAVRWAGQFEQPDGGDPAQAMRMYELEGASVPVQLVEVTGTYDGGMTMTAAPPDKKEDYMLLGAIAEGGDAPWFFKLTGPEATVRAQHDAFVGMMKSLRGGS